MNKIEQLLFKYQGFLNSIKVREYILYLNNISRK